MIESYNVVYHLQLPLDQIQEVVRAAISSISTVGVVTTNANCGVTTSVQNGVTNGSNDCVYSSIPPTTSSSGGGGVGCGGDGGEDGDRGGRGGAAKEDVTKNGAISIEALLNVLSANLELNHVESSILAPTTITV